jgi:hypothetical protein
LIGPDLSTYEAIVDRSGVAEDIEAVLPHGVRRRQLRVRTLLLGALVALGDDRPGHLVRIHRALVSLDPDERERLGVDQNGHRLTYRQVEYTFSLVVRALSKKVPDGTPSSLLASVLDALVEASVPDEHTDASRALAVDWSDIESFARPPTSLTKSVDNEASWGHRQGGPTKGELFFGCYFSAATMVREESGPGVCELVRRIWLSTCSLDPVPAFVAVLSRLVDSGVALGDVLCDSGYAHRRAENWALPIRRLGGRLVMDLHPHDRGRQGTFGGATCFNGALYCPATPVALFDVAPLGRGAHAEEREAHDRRTAELARYKLGRISTDDADGFHRVMCPAVMGKVRCPARPDSLVLGYERPQVIDLPPERPRCCAQETLTVPPEVNAKTAQKHDYPSRAHRQSFARRTAVERAYSTLKDPASTDVTRGWCRTTSMCALALFLVCAVVVRNVRVVDAFEEHAADERRCQEAGLPPKTRRRRRRTIDDLVSAST